MTYSELRASKLSFVAQSFDQSLIDDDEYMGSVIGRMLRIANKSKIRVDEVMVLPCEESFINFQPYIAFVAH